MPVTHPPPERPNVVTPALPMRCAARLFTIAAAVLLMLVGRLASIENAPRIESLQIVPEVPFINIFLTAGPFTEEQLKDWTPPGKLPALGSEPVGLANPDHHTWTLYNQGRYPARFGDNLPPAKHRRYMLLCFDLATDAPGSRYLQMTTNYGRQLRAWQGAKLVYTQEPTTYQTTGAIVTLGDQPETFTLAVELSATPSLVDLGILAASGAKSTAAHSLRLPLPAGCTTERLFADGMIFQAPYPMLNAQGAAEVRAWGCSPKMPLDRKFTLSVKQGETVLGRAEFANSRALEQRGVSFEVKPAGTHGVIDLTVGVEIEGLTLPTRTLQLYSTTGLRTDLAALDADLEKLPHDAAPNTRFRREKVEMLLNASALQTAGLPAAEAETLVAEIARVRSLLKLEAAGEFAFAGQTGYSEQAYVAPQDRSVQPYLVYVPVDYNPERSYPLVCYLHGYVPTYARHNWIDLRQIPEFVAAMERNDCILCVPFGRSNTDFLQVGEVDTLAVIAEMRAHYRIDPTRVYLYGYSMGGSGVYTLATHFPHHFAAGVVLAGRTDYYLWHRPAKTQTARFKQVMISRDNPIEQIDNLSQFPLQIHHGQQDMAVDLRHTHRLQEALQARKWTCDVREYPNGSHWIGVDVMGKDEPLQFLLQFRRTAAMDDRVTIKTWSSQFGARNNFAVLLTDDPTQPAELEAHWDNGRLTIERMVNVGAMEVRNIAPVRRAEFELVTPPGLDLKAEWIDEPALLSRLVLTPKNSPLTQAQLDDPARRLKTPDTAGTVQDAFNGPFILTYGTQTDAEPNRAKALDWAREWEEFAKGKATVLADTAITETIAAAHNLVLIGSPTSHSYWKQMQPKLPIGLDGDTVTIDDHTIPLNAKRGLLYIYPNPAHPRRYLVLNAGLRYGAGLPINHKLDLVPDFLVYTDKTMTGGDDTNTPLVGGFFTRDWKLDPRYIDSFGE